MEVDDPDRRRSSPSLTGFLPIDALLHLTNIGTLFAFVIVCAAVLIMRRTNPDAERPFRAPLYPFVPILGILSCLMLMFSLPVENWYRLIVWMALGFVHLLRLRLHAQRAAEAGRGSHRDGWTAATVARSFPGASSDKPLLRAQGPVVAVAAARLGHRRRHDRLHRDRGVERVGRVLHDGHHRDDRRLQGSPRPLPRRQVFTVVLLLGGVGAALYTFTLLATVVVEGGYPSGCSGDGTDA